MDQPRSSQTPSGRSLRRLALALGALLLVGVGAWALLPRPSAGCTPKPDDPAQYLVRICEHLRANQIDVSPGDPDGYAIKAVEEREQDGRPVVWVFLTCCHMGDIAIIDKATGEVISFRAGPQ